jgi:hypothetical protein
MFHELYEHLEKKRMVVFIVYVYCKRVEAQLKRKMEKLAKGKWYLL